MLVRPVDAMLWKHSSVQHSECGVTMTLSMTSRGFSGSTGSCSNTSSAPPAQCLDESRFVDDGAARDVDEVGGRLHLSKLARADQMAGAFVEQATDDHEVGLGEQGGEVDLARAEVSELESVHDGISGKK